MSSPLAAVTKKETFEVRFIEFESLPKRKGRDFFDSAEFTCFGHQWNLRVWPGGHSSSADGMVSIGLRHLSKRCIEAEFGFTIKKSNTQIAAHYNGKWNFKFHSVQGTPNLALWSTLIDALQERVLIIDVQIRQLDPACLTFVPENPFCKNILKKFMDKESADVVFELGGGIMTFHAHRFILQQCSSVLAELCKSEGDLTPIPITGVKPAIFLHVMYYAYGGNVDNDDLEANAKDIIDAADRFGVVNLKLKAEACYVKMTNISIGNMMENLVYAHDKNCALLKEAVMDFIVENGMDVEEKDSLEDAPSGLHADLLADLLNAVNREKEKNAGEGRGTKRRGDELSMMRVDDLRRKLCEKGLDVDVDGSRKTMIAALRENS